MLTDVSPLCLSISLFVCLIIPLSLIPTGHFALVTGTLN